MPEASENDLHPQVTSDLLSLVMQPAIPAEVIATWTPREREEAARWASAGHLAASDNFRVKRLPQPGFVARAAEICGSPAKAQLAVEAWTQYRERGEFSAGWQDVYEVAQDAVTGLLALLGSRPAPGTAVPWRRAVLEVLRANPEGMRMVDLMGLLGTACPPQEVLEDWLARGHADGWVRRPGADSWALEGRG
jgi:hypothetical protein